MGELKRLLKRKTLFVIALIAAAELVSFVVGMPRIDAEERIREKTRYLEDYPVSVETTLKNAQTMLAMNIFGGKDDYTRRNILKTKEDYGRVSALKPELDDDQATQAVLSYRYTVFFVYAIMLYILYETCKERKNGMLPLTYSAKGGRRMLAFNRGISLFMISFVMTVLLYVVNIITACMIYGADDFGGPIQTISSYAGYTFLHSKGLYLLLVTLKSAFCAGVLTIFTYMICNMSAGVNIPLMITGTVLWAEWWLSVNISGVSRFRNLKYINIYNCFDCGIFDRQYTNTGVFNKCVSAGTLFFFSAALLLAFCSVLSVVSYKRRTRELPAPVWRIRCVIEEMTQKLLEQIGFSMKELWKLMVVKKGVLPAAALIIVFIYTWDHTVITFPQRFKEMDEVYHEYGGADWTRFEQYVSELTELKDEYDSEAASITERIQSGEENPEKIGRVIGLQGESKDIKNRLDEYNKKLVSRDKLKEEKDIETYLISDRGFNEAIGSNSVMRENIYGIMLLIFVILITAMAFQIESDSGVISVLAPSYKGSSWVYMKKCVILLILAVFGCAAVYCADFLMLRSVYDLQHLNAPVQSLLFMSDTNIRISVLQYMMLQWAVRLVYILVIQGVTILAACRKYIGNQSYVLIFMIAAGIGFVFLMKLSAVLWILTAAAGIPVYAALIYTAHGMWRHPG